MNISYSDEVIELFAAPEHVYDMHVWRETHLMGYAGDLSIGEYVHLYFQIEKAANYIDSKILAAKFNAIGGVMTIAAAEKFCSLIKGKTFQEALNYCDPQTGLPNILSIPEGKLYSVNFVLNAFYKALETLTVSQYSIMLLSMEIK